MSRISAWAASLFSSSQLNLQNKGELDKNRFKSDASVQTLMTASGTKNINISNECLLRKISEDQDVHVLYLSKEALESDAKSTNKKNRRNRIPNKPNLSSGLLSILKDCIGQNLSQVAMPVNFNEPLSILQRITEHFEYSYLLDKAADAEDIYDQIAYLAAFNISGYATSALRAGKPFNPLLGETYEYDRSDDLGWKCISEQVSHHPEISALHCESQKWICWKQFSGNMSFRGKYIRIIPSDVTYVKFKTNQKTYKLDSAETTVHNVLFGKIWLDHSGEVCIVGMDNEAKCTLTFVPYSSFTRGAQRKVYGIITDASNEMKRFIRGNWDREVKVAFDVNGVTSSDKATYETVWERRTINPESKAYYNFSEFTCELNEFEADVSPTDSRMRPDIRLMEEAKWDEANETKLRLEEKQRQEIHRRGTENAASVVNTSSTADQYTPTWFVKEKDSMCASSETFIYIYKGGYWEAKKTGDWSGTPDIF